MNGSKNTAIVVLTAIAITAGVVAWREYLELRELRARVAAQTNLEHRAAAAEQRANALEKQVASARREAAPRAMGKSDTREEGAPGNPRMIMAKAAAMMDRPEVQRMMALRQRAALDSRYAALFKQLGLSPEKLDQLKNLMVERQQVGSDVFAAAAKQGIDPMQDRAELARLTSEGQAKVDADIKSLLGDGDYSTYQNYQATLPQRALVNQLQQSLSYTSAPLTDTQAEQLVQILAQNQPAHSAEGGGTRTVVTTGTISAGPGPDAGFVGPMMGFGGTTVTDSAVDAARSVLTEPQVTALQQLQAQQAELQNAMKSTGTAVAPGGPAVIQYRTIVPEPPPPKTGG